MVTKALIILCQHNMQGTLTSQAPYGGCGLSFLQENISLTSFNYVFMRVTEAALDVSLHSNTK